MAKNTPEGANMENAEVKAYGKPGPDMPLETAKSGYGKKKAKKMEADYKGDEEHVALVEKINELEKAEVKHAMGDTDKPKELAKEIEKVEEKAPVEASQTVEADFMEKEIFPAKGLSVETDEGTLYLPEITADELDTMLGKGTYFDVEPLEGFFGRFSAPGYLDATPYVFGESEQEVAEELERLYGLDEGGVVEAAKMTEKGSDWVSKKISKLKDEGYPQKQAVAIALSMARKKGYKTPPKVEGSQEVVAPVETAPVVEAAVEVEAAKTPQIEIVKDGKVIDTFPDAFGDDASAVKAFFKKLYSIKEEKEEKEPKGEKKEEKAEDLEKKPKALPKVEEPKEEKAPEAEEMPMAASKVEAAPVVEAKEKKPHFHEIPVGDEQGPVEVPEHLPEIPVGDEQVADKRKMKGSAATENFVKVEASESDELAKVQAFFENRIKMVREIVASLVEKNHVVAEQNDIDQFLLQGKDLSTSVDEALKLSADRKFRELQAQSDAELLSLKASLPNLKMRTAKVDIQASKEIEGGLDLMQLAILASVNNEGKTDAQFSIGAAFGAGLF